MNELYDSELINSYSEFKTAKYNLAIPAPGPFCPPPPHPLLRTGRAGKNGVIAFRPSFQILILSQTFNRMGLKIQGEFHLSKQSSAIPIRDPCGVFEVNVVVSFVSISVHST